MRRRVWIEHLPLSELTSPAVAQVLNGRGIQALIAFPDDGSDANRANALKRLVSSGASVGVWPLLSDGDGYWPSDANAAAFETRIARLFEVLEAAGVHPATLVLDLEPPLSVTRALMGSGAPWMLARRAARAWGKVGAEERSRAAITFARVLDRVGCEILAVVPPPIAFDLVAGGSLFQPIFGTSVQTLRFQTLSAMTYSSMMRDFIPGRSRGAACEIVYETGQQLQRWGRANPSLSLGVVGVGKLGNEASISCVEELCEDVAAARAAGIDDIALFALEGILSQSQPEKWLDAFDAAPRIPTRGAATYALRGLRGSIQILGRLQRL